jgi:hypothetical protein
MRFHEHVLAVLAILVGSALLGLAVYGFGMLFFVNR